MKTLSSISAAAADSGAPAVPKHAAHNTQSQKGFWRRQRYSKLGIHFESSTGAALFIPVSELDKLAEAHDPLYVTPKT